jgi:hypothetical protein
METTHSLICKYKGDISDHGLCYVGDDKLWVTWNVLARKSYNKKFGYFTSGFYSDIEDKSLIREEDESYIYFENDQEYLERMKQALSALKEELTENTQVVYLQELPYKDDRLNVQVKLLFNDFFVENNYDFHYDEYCELGLAVNKKHHKKFVGDYYSENKKMQGVVYTRAYRSSVCYLNVHLKWEGKENQNKTINELNEFIKEIDEEEIILAGDFNRENYDLPQEFPYETEGIDSFIKKLKMPREDYGTLRLYKSMTNTNFTLKNKDQRKYTSSDYIIQIL